MSMTIGIIGAGPIGTTLARFARAAGHNVLLANSRGPDTLAAVAEELKVEAVSASDAAMAKDLVIVAIPQKAVNMLPPHLFVHTPSSCAIIDAGNYFPKTRDGAIPEIDNGLLDSEFVSRRIGRSVIKAFNMIEASRLATGGRIAGTLDRIAIAVAGDDASAKGKVVSFIHEIGFDTVDAGPLSESWRFQPGTQGYCRGYDIVRLRASFAGLRRERIAQYREECDDYAAEVVHALGGAVGAALLASTR